MRTSHNATHLVAPLLAGLLIASCILDRDGGAPGGAGGAGASIPGGGSGGLECTGVSDCPDPHSLCATPRCAEGACDLEYALRGTACTDNLGQYCNGEGLCVRDAGHPCASMLDCLSGYCVDGLCCDEICDGPCVSCNLDPQPGTCTPHPVATDLGADCVDGVCDGSGHCAGGRTTAGVGFGDALADDGLVVAVDSAGDVIVAGTFSGTIDLGGGVLDAGTDGPDVFLAKLDGSLGHKWSKKLGGISVQTVTAVAIDSADNVIVGGFFYGTIDAGGGALSSASDTDIWLAKYDPAGTLLWGKRFGGSDTQRLMGIAVDAQGNIVLAGAFRGELDFAGGVPLAYDFNWDLFVAKLDSNGNHLWSRGYGDFWDEVAAGVAVDAAGRITVIGSFDDSVSFGGPIVVSDAQDAFLLRLSSDGDYQWAVPFGGAGDQTGVSITANEDGELLIGGDMLGTMTLGSQSWTTDGSQDVFLAKVTVSGQVLWGKYYGSTGTQQLAAVAFDPWGNLVAAGSSDGGIDLGGGALSSAGLFDGFVVKLSPDGQYLHGHQYGDIDNDSFADVAAGPDGALLVTGSFAGGIDLGNNILLNSLGLTDALLLKLEP